ncbi:MAG: GAF domain-containing protein [Chloroflexi bacterium]|nr:GAF domain-containing protein [Chloroflexota bacterium]
MPRFTNRFRWVERGFILVLAALFFITFPFLHQVVGDSATAFSVFPVAAVGWYFGLGWGIIASLLAIIANSILLTTSSDFGIFLLAQKAFIPGAIIIVLVGIISGSVRRFVEQRSQVEEELRARERYLTMLNEITASILGTEKMEEIYQKLPASLAELLGADDCYFTRWDSTLNQIIPSGASGTSARTYLEIKFDPEEINLSQAVLEAGHAIGVENVETSPLVNPSILAQFSCKSILGIPLIIGNHRLGAALIAYKNYHTFDSDEIRRAEQAGNLVALALWDIQQDIELARRLRESNALAEIGRALSESERIGLDRVLQMIVESARDLIPGAEKTVIHLLDIEQQALIPRAVTGITELSGGQLNMRLGEGVAGQVFATGVVINIADVETDPRFLRDETPPRFRSLMVSSIQSGKERLGTISVQSGKPNAFNMDEQQLLAGFGVQAAIAIENARLLETTQRRLKEVDALYRITRELAASLDADQLMQEVVDLLQAIFGYYHVSIVVVEPASGELVIKHESGERGILLRGARLSAGAGIIGHVAETGEAFFTNNVEDVVFFVPHPLLAETHSELAMPIKVSDSVLGVLDIQQSSPRRLHQHDLQLISAVAEQLAISLQKAELYSNLQDSLNMEKSMRMQLIQSERLALVGRLLASVSHELNNPLQAIQNALFLIKDDEGMSSQSRQDLQIVLSETERMAGLIERLRASYRPPQLDEFQPIQLNVIVEDVYALLATHLRHKNVAFEFHPDPNLPLVSGLPDQLRQVTLNLLMNGVEAIPSGGLLTVSTQMTENKEAMLAVADTGPGIDPALLPRIFDAFVTSKESGTGLGLTITYDIVQRHNGRIEAENNPDGGATFKIWLPAYRSEEI